MKTKVYKNKDGFTLIELLVVVAIVGLLSSIVMVSLRDSKIKAQNTAKNQLVAEYVKVLELFRQDKGTFPNFRNPTSKIYYCLGPHTTSCQTLFSRTTDAELSNALDDYLPGPPADNYSVPFGTKDLKGIAYACADGDLIEPCYSYELVWYLNGVDLGCLAGAVPKNFPRTNSLHTECRFNSSSN